MQDARVRTFDEVRIENTNRCGYRCHFCPRESLTRDKGVMSIEDLTLVLQRVGPHAGRVDLHGFGEPMLDRLLVEKTRLVRRTWPRATPTIYSTLGVHVEDDYFERLIDAGLAELQVSFYGADATSYQRVHGVQRYALARKNLELLRHAAQTRPNFSLILRDHPVSDALPRAENEKAELSNFLREWQDAAGGDVRERALHNFGDGRRFNAAGKGAPCSVVGGFRSRVLQVTWDLKVVPCCFDFDASIVLGDLRVQTPDEIFASTTYLAFIAAHRTDDLHEYPVCTACERCRLP
jgi:hypothetical protein